MLNIRKTASVIFGVVMEMTAGFFVGAILPFVLYFLCEYNI